MAERQGFEPWEGYKPSTVFKTVAFGRSATSPAGRAEYSKQSLPAIQNCRNLGYCSYLHTGKRNSAEHQSFLFTKPEALTVAVIIDFF